MKCKTCSHPQRQAIDHLLLVGTHTLEALSRQYGLTVSSLFRHKQHLVENLDRARARLSNSQQLGQLLKLNAILDQVQRAVDTADADGDVDRVLRGASASARIIRQISQMEVPLELDTVYRLISSPQWVSQDSLLPTDPTIITGIHQTILDTTLTPCPDEKPEAISQTAAGDTIPPQIPDQATPLRPETLPHLSANPDIAPKTEREKSAKLPKKANPFRENISQNQSDNHIKKNLSKNPAAGWESPAAPVSCPASVSPPEYPLPGAIVMPEPIPSPVPASRFPRVSPAANQEIETVSPGTRTSAPEKSLPGLTPEMRRQIFTRLFPAGDGAREPVKTPPPPPPPSSKYPKISNIFRFFRKKPMASPEAVAGASQAPGAAPPSCPGVPSQPLPAASSRFLFSLASARHETNFPSHSP